MNPSLARLSLLLPALLLSACLTESASPEPPASDSAGLRVEVAALRTELAARSSAADPGGVLLVEVAQPARGLLRRDSVAWTGAVSGGLVFPSLPEGSDYRVRSWYRDPQGLATHGDSLGGLTLARGQTARVQLLLKALLGKVVLNAPAVPTSVDTLRLAWTSPGVRRSAQGVRGTGGRTLLRLDSLPVGQEGVLRLRAWNIAGDTLFHLDTVLALSGDADLPLSLSLRNSRGQIGLTLSLLPGGELDATASFDGEAEQPAQQTGRLVLSAFSDSGASDWIAIHNPGPAYTGRVRLGKGTTDAQFDLDLAAGATAVVTRAPCAAVQAPDHALRSAPAVVCGIDEAVVTHSTSGGSLWKLRDATGQDLFDAVLVLDGKQSWPDLNTSGARTARVRTSWRSALSNDAGLAWCADGSDAPATACP